MKKTLSVGLVVVLILFCVSGCKSRNDNSVIPTLSSDPNNESNTSASITPTFSDVPGPVGEGFFDNTIFCSIAWANQKK